MSRDPAAVALGDQWFAEALDIAREIAKKAAPDESFDQDEWALIEAGMGTGIGAAMVLLQRHGVLPT